MFSDALPNRYIEVCITTQTLDLIENSVVLSSYPVSTAKNGVGQRMGSECTPTGWHKIRAKIGDKQPINSVFIGRRVTGEIYTPKLSKQYPDRDWVLTRILWLGGVEAGFNRYGIVDSAWRYIYIHGCPDHLLQGVPQSHGCIRMLNADVLDLFNQLKVGESVFIHA
ncbi:MAG: L,D-transpeptidase family protein [Methyloprofundus sp.]|nr:L,D-transpeptidase family protein [Methyloprofundus sp.]